MPHREKTVQLGVVSLSNGKQKGAETEGVPLPPLPPVPHHLTFGATDHEGLPQAQERVEGGVSDNTRITAAHLMVALDAIQAAQCARESKSVCTGYTIEMYAHVAKVFNAILADMYVPVPADPV